MKKYLLATMLLVSSVWLVPHAHAAIVFVQAASSTKTNGSSATTTTMLISPTAGDFLFVGCGSGNASDTCAVSDNVGDTYTTGTSLFENVIGFIVFPNWLTNIPAGITSIRCSFIKTFTVSNCVVEEFSGIATTNPLDGIQKNATSSSFASPAVYTTPSITTTNANDLLINLSGDAEAKIYASTTNWTIPNGGQSGINSALGNSADYYRITTSTGTFAVAGSASPGGNDRFVNTLFAFQAGGGTPAVALTADVTINTGTTIMIGVTIK